MIILKEIRLHRTEYYEKLTLIVIKNLIRIKKRITYLNLPKAISNLQNIFIESFSIAILAVYEVSNPSNNKTIKINNVRYVTLNEKINNLKQKYLKNSKYSKSTKSLKYRNALPKKSQISVDKIKILKSQVDTENSKIRFKLLKQINFKSYKKNYKSNIIKCVFIPKKNNGRYRPLNVPTITDRILQQVIS